MGGIEIGLDETLCIATADLKDAFYHLSLPAEIRDYFTLTAVRAADVGITSLNGRKLHKFARVTPRLAVVPMGWSWALFLCQSVHEALALKAGLGEENRLRDRQPAPHTDVFHTQYVDNMIIMGTDKAKVERSFKTATKVLRDSGLQVHEEEFSTDGAKILGWEFTKDGGFKPGHHRVWKLRLAIRALLDRGHCTAHLMEKVVGHCCFVALGRREIFSVLGDVYSFIHQNRTSTLDIPLWKSIRKELQIFDGLLPLVFRDLRAQWSPKVHAVDASEFGLGATAAEFEIGMVRHLGQYNERWRFRDPLNKNPRQHILAEQYDGVGYEVLVDAGLEGNHDTADSPVFQNVPFAAVDRVWHTVGRFSWKERASLPVYEARSGLFAAKHILRSRGNFGKKHLVLSDSLTAVCAFSRGRSSNFNLRRVCCQLGALALSTGSSFHFRWIPSEWNPADGPSRGKWAPSKPQQFFDHGAFQKPDPRQPVEMERDCEENYSQAKANTNSVKSFGSPQDNSTDRDADSQQQIHSIDQENSKIKSPQYFEKSWPTSDSSRSSSGLNSMPESVYLPLGNVETYGVQQERAVTLIDKSGSENCSQAGANVRGWRRHQHSTVCDGIIPAFQSGTSVTQYGKFSACEAEPKGLEEVSSKPQSPAGALGGNSSFGDEEYPHGIGAFGNSDVADVRPLSTTKRDAQAEMLRFGPPKSASWCGISVLDDNPSPAGGGDPIQDSGVRRMSAAGPYIPSGDRRVHQQVHCSATVEQQGFDPTTLQCGLGQISGSNDCAGKIDSHRRDSPVQVSSRRSFSRSQQSVERIAKHPAKRTVEKPGQRQKIPEGGSFESSLRGPRRRDSIKVHCRGRKSVAIAAQAALKCTVSPSLQCPVFLEIFSGCGRLGSTIAKDNGWPTLLWDIELGPEYDLRKQQNRQLLLGWLRAGFVRGGHLGTPCNSFSRARDRAPGPPPLRSDQHVMGLPDLRPCDALKVAEGNLFMRFSVQFMVLCSVLGIGCTLENPGRSRLWLTPAVKRLLRMRTASFVLFEMCMFGTPWKKTTGIAAVHVNVELLSHYRCRGTRRGICKFSGKTHVPLCGTDSRGQFRTKAAQVYPYGLCHSLATCFMSLEAERRAKKFCSAFGQ